MTALAPMSIAMNGTLAASQPTSQASSPASPTANFGLQQQTMLSMASSSKSPSPSSGSSGGYAYGHGAIPSHMRSSSRSESLPSPSLAELPPGISSYGEYVRTWTDDQVGHWLADSKCRALAPTFAANDIRGAVLLDLDQATLKEMGITSVGDRIKVLNAVKTLRQRCSTRVSQAATNVAIKSYHQQQMLDNNGSYAHSLGNRSPAFSLVESPVASSPPLIPAVRHNRGQRPAPLQLRSTTQADLPRLIRDPHPPPDSARSTTPLRQQPPGASIIQPPQLSVSVANNARLPPLPPPPRSQPPLPPAPSAQGQSHSSRAQTLASQHQQSSGRRTPTQTEPHTHHQLHVQTSQTSLSQSQLTPIGGPPSSLATPTAPTGNGASWKNSDREYGLPSGPRSGLQTPNTSGSLSRAASPNMQGRSPQTVRQHNKASSLSTGPSVTPTPPSKDRPVRPNTSGSAHPYALQPPPTNTLANNLSPISESFNSQHGGAGAGSAYAVGRGPFTHQHQQLYPFPSQEKQQSQQPGRPTTPSHNAALSLDDLRRRLIKFYLPEGGHSVTVNTADCQDGFDVLERVLKKFGKLNSKDDPTNLAETSEDGGLIIDNWGVFLDWQGDDASAKPMREAEILSVCSASLDHPVRKQGLIVRRVGKPKRTKVLQQIFGEQAPSAPMVNITNSSSSTATITNRKESNSPTSLLFASNPNLSGDEDDDDPSQGPYGLSGLAKSVKDRELRNMKRASSISVLSGLGVPDPERVLESTNDTSPSSSSSHLGKDVANGGAGAKSPSSNTFAGKIRTFLGQRPPSELIATHLPAYFPYTQPKVLRRTLRQSVRLSSMVTGGKRESTISINNQGNGQNLPSRFSSSTVGSHLGYRTSISPSRASSISLPPPPVPEKSPSKGGDAIEEPPRLSISTSDGHTSTLDHANEDETHRVANDEEETGSMESGVKAPQLLPPVNFPTESFSDAFHSVTSGVPGAGMRSGATPSMSRTTSNASRRMSYMTELRSRRDRSDTASMLTVDEITAEVENRRMSTAISSLRSSDSVEDDINVEGEIMDEPDQYIDTTEELVAGAEDDDESDDDDDDSDTLDEGYDVVEEEDTLADDDPDDVHPVKATGGKRGTKWIRGALIGSGSFGQVYLGMDAMNGLLMAVKQVPLPSGSGPNEERKKTNLWALEREIDLLKDLQHENIVQYLDSSSDDSFLNIFLEYVPGGSVSALLRNYGAFEETLCRHFVRQILQGLIYLHDRDIIHRDIKGANILVDNKGGIKISDFGISKKVEEIPSLVPQALASKVGRNRESFKGTVFWMAPEAVQQKSYTRKADIWSVGCLVVEMLTGQRPWPNLTEFQAIFKVGMNAKPEFPADISSEAEDFLNKTFEFNTEIRPSAKELLQHPWIVKGGSSATKPAGAKSKTNKNAS